MYQIELSGLPGDKMLGDMAAIGVFRILHKVWGDDVLMSWGRDRNKPIIHTLEPKTQEDILDTLMPVLGKQPIYWDLGRDKDWESFYGLQKLKKAEDVKKSKEAKKSKKVKEAEAAKEAADALEDARAAESDEERKVRVAMAKETEDAKKVKDAEDFKKSFIRNLRFPQGYFEIKSKDAFNDDEKESWYLAFGNEQCVDADSIIQYTMLSTANGGNYNFLSDLRELVKYTLKEDIKKSLFSQWAYADGGGKNKTGKENKNRNCSFRWDPMDYRSGVSRSSYRVTTLLFERGAHRLALEALPCYPVIPRQGEGITSGFKVEDRKKYFCWPLWDFPVKFRTMKSMLLLPDIVSNNPNRDKLERMGIFSIYQSQRLSITKTLYFLQPTLV